MWKKDLQIEIPEMDWLAFWRQGNKEKRKNITKLPDNEDRRRMEVITIVERGGMSERIT